MEREDLERVRECLYQYCNDCYFDEDSNEWGDCSCGGEVAKAGEDLAAHLKEDAEREAELERMASHFEYGENPLTVRIEELEALVQTKQESEVQLNRNWQDMKADNARLRELEAKSRRVDHAEANLDKEIEFSHGLLKRIQELEAALRRCQYEGMLPVTLNDEIDQALQGGQDG